jgi:1-acyl-sn-glycerol-3-phosphate acyltransferase
MEVNIACSCKKRFDDILLLVLLLPCNHFIHEMCINKCLLNNINKCPLCSTDITEILTEEKIKISKNKQYLIDLRSLKYEEKNTVVNYSLYPKMILNMNILLNKIMSIKTQENIIETVEFVLKLCKIKINILDNTNKNPIIYKNNKIEWKNKIDNDKKIVILPNHSNYLDSIILYYLFQCGFVASEWLNTTSIGKIIVNKCNLLLFKRDEKPGGNVEKIRNYLEEFKKIVIFPEGVMSFNKSLFKFRTGAFYSSNDVCPVVIKYNPYVYDEDFNILLLKVLSQDKIDIDIIINDIESGPFDEVKIEKIRKKMAKNGNLKLSNISNRKSND